MNKRPKKLLDQACTEPCPEPAEGLSKYPLDLQGTLRLWAQVGGMSADVAQDASWSPPERFLPTLGQSNRGGAATIRA